MTLRLRAAWRRLVARAPRRLTITRAGKCLIAIAMAAGLAALNTGNNPLFLAWGMVLGAMVVSGVLSEAALRPLDVTLRLPDEVRAQVPCHVRATLTNRSRFVPAMAVEVLVYGSDAEGAHLLLHAPFELRLDASCQRELFVPLTARRRGHHTIHGLSVRTAYPFGLFVKERPLPCVPQHFLVLPEPSCPQPNGVAQKGQKGEHAALQVGAGEDYFATRGYRVGDPLKHVLWRRVAKTGRWMVVEREAMRTRHITAALAIAPAAPPHEVEAAISAAGTWLEQMLAVGLAVGLRAPGIRIAPEADGPGRRTQRRALLQALAGLGGPAPTHTAPGGGPHEGAWVQLVAPGLAQGPRGTPAVHLVPQPRTPS